MKRRSAAGFTLLEVMIALALLGFGLTVLIKSAAGSMASAKQAQLIGVVTDLSRGKMYDLEELLIKDGFTDTDNCPKDETFEAEGWPSIKYSATCDPVELPSFDQLQAMAQAQAAGSGSGSGSGSDGASSEGMLPGLMSQFGMFAGGEQSADAQAGASFIQSFYQMVQETLKASIRKVTLTVKWEVMGEERELKTVAYFTDAPAMDKVLRGLGSQEGGTGGTGGTGGSGGSAGSGGRGGGGSTGGGGGTGGGKPPTRPNP